MKYAVILSLHIYCQDSWASEWDQQNLFIGIPDISNKNNKLRILLALPRLKLKEVLCFYRVPLAWQCWCWPTYGQSVMITVWHLGCVWTSPWLLGCHCLHPWDLLQHDQHPGVDTQGHEEQPHQPSPDRNGSGWYDGHGRIHSLCPPHVPLPGQL